MVETNEHTTPASGGATGSSTPKSDSELIKLMLKMLDEQRTDREEQKAARDKQHDMLKELLVEQRKDREE
ncbi:hypothetical protein IWW50_001333 [Coemansia erecta]|nr:hypothetical protein IWW50_001333 [Coemansia erecta]